MYIHMGQALKGLQDPPPPPPPHASTWAGRRATSSILELHVQVCMYIPVACVCVCVTHGIGVRKEGKKKEGRKEGKKEKLRLFPTYMPKMMIVRYVHR